MTRTEVQSTVLEVLSTALQASGKPAPPIAVEAHLLADLGLTSLDLAEIAIGLEAGLGLSEFPIMDWLKQEAQRTDDAALTVGALVDACVTLVAESSAEELRGPRLESHDAAVTAARRAPAPVAWIACGVVLCAAVVVTLIASH